MSGHHFALGTPPSIGWVGRSYAHFTLPTPQFTGEYAELIDSAICAADDWQHFEDQLVFPITMMRWVRPRSLLILATGGWYPCLITLTGMRAKKDSSGGTTPARYAGAGNRRTRSALVRVTDALSRNGARVITDEELSQTVSSLQQRAAQAASLDSRAAAQQFFVDYRSCEKCNSWSGHDASHCRTCGHRFDSAEDLKRDAQTRSAKDIIGQCTKQVTALGRGEGLFQDWPRQPGQSAQPGPPGPPTPGQPLEGVIAR